MWSDWWIYLVVIILFIVLLIAARWRLISESNFRKRWSWEDIAILVLFLWVLFITWFLILIVRGSDVRQEQTTIEC